MNQFSIDRSLGFGLVPQQVAGPGYRLLGDPSRKSSAAQGMTSYTG